MAGPLNVRSVLENQPNSSFLRDAPGATCSLLTPLRPEGSSVSERPFRCHQGAWWGLLLSRLSLSPPLPHVTQALTCDPGSLASSFLYFNDSLTPGRSQVGPSNLASEKRQRCLLVAKTRLCKGVNPLPSQRGQGEACPSVLWQTKVRGQGRSHSRTTLSQTFFKPAHRRKINLGDVHLDLYWQFSKP